LQPIERGADHRNIRRFVGREEEFDAIEPPFLDAREERILFLSHLSGPNHGIDAEFHSFFLRKNSYQLSAVSYQLEPFGSRFSALGVGTQQRL
jgi:hypothetical protein